MAFSSASDGPEAAAKRSNRRVTIASGPEGWNSARLPRGLRLWLGVCALVGGAFFTSQLLEIPARSALRGYDNTFNYLWLRSLVEDGDWDFHNDVAECNTLVPEQRASALALPPTPAGRLPNKYGIGWAVLTAPFYLLAELLVAIGRWTGLWSLTADGFSPIYQIAVQSGHAGLALAGLWLAVRVIAWWIGSRPAAVAGVLAVWGASPLLYYQTVNLSMSHGAAFFAVALLAFALERATTMDEVAAPRWNGGWWLLVGAAFGLAVTTRFQLSVFGVVILWAIWRDNDGSTVLRLGRGAPWCARGRRKRRPYDARGRRKRRPYEDAVKTEIRGEPLLPPKPRLNGRGPAGGPGNIGRRIGLLTLGVAPWVLLQMTAWRVVYGEWVVFGYGAEGEAFHWSRPELVASLFSPWHGLFYWHPFLLVAAGGMIGWAWWARGAAFGWCAAVIATAYLNAAWWCWWFASSFGNRGYDAALLPMMAGAAWLFAAVGERGRRCLGALAATAGAWNVYLALLYRSGAISRHAPLTWSEMLEAAKQLPDALHW